MQEFLFRFGFESPAEREHNRANGTDDESSHCIFISADSPEEAIAWGRAIAEEFAKRLHKDRTISWMKEGFASWIETRSDEIECARKWAGAQHTSVGTHPNYDQMIAD